MTYSIQINSNTKLEISDTLFKPYRKRPTLSIGRGNCSTKIASFNNWESAIEFLKCFGYKESING